MALCCEGAYDSSTRFGLRHIIYVLRRRIIFRDSDVATVNFLHFGEINVQLMDSGHIEAPRRKMREKKPRLKPSSIPLIDLLTVPMSDDESSLTSYLPMFSAAKSRMFPDDMVNF